MPTILANNATLGYNVSTSGSYTNIAVKSITAPDPEWAVTDVSGLADATNIKLPGFVDNKEFSFECYHSAATLGLIPLLCGVVVNYQIALSDASSSAFAAIVKSYKSKLERNGSVVYEFSADITGPITVVT